jgi:hypothetical protein
MPEWEAPATPDELREWLARELKISVARHALLREHQAPMEYLAHAFFADSLDQGPTDCVVWANRGGGKTFYGAIATLLDLVFKPGIEIRILAGSLDQSKRMYAHLRRLFSPTEHPALADLVDGRITERRLVLTNGSAVELLAQSQTSVRGTRVHKLRCDEADLFDPAIWEAAQLTTRSGRCGRVLVRGTIECLSTMHLPHGVMSRLVREARRGTRRLFRWGVVDVLEHCPASRPCRAHEEECPLLPECRGRAKDRTPDEAGHIPIDDAIAQKRRVSHAAWESEMLCLRPRRTDAVIPEFDPRAHLFADDTRLRTRAGLWLAGMDFGFRAAVILWACVDDEDVLWVVDERHQRDTLLEEHIAAMRRGLERPGTRAWPAPAWVGVDPAGLQRSDKSADTSVGALRKAGFRVRPIRVTLHEGLEMVRARLSPACGRPRLFIHERCAHLIESLERYRYEPGTDRPCKRDGFDHAPDALRYLVVSLDARRTRAESLNYAQ